jgi:hypothetical protein
VAQRTVRAFELMMENEQDGHGRGKNGEIPCQPLRTMRPDRGDCSAFFAGRRFAPRKRKRQLPAPFSAGGVRPPAIADRTRDTLNGPMLADSMNAMPDMVRAASE